MKDKNSKSVLAIAIIVLQFLALSGCRKVTELDPPSTRITSEAIFSNDVTATSVLTDIFASISNNNMVDVTSIHGVGLYAGLSADELRVLPNQTNATLNAFYNNSLDVNNTLATSSISWSGTYLLIFKLNAALIGLQSSSSLTPFVKNQLIGEAKFMRAFCYFYLTNLYGDIPLILNQDYLTNSSTVRTPKLQIYDQVVVDLNDAKVLLSESYLNANMTVGSERVRPTTWAASALLARVYLFLGSLGKTDAWQKAETESTRVIEKTTLFSLVNLSNVFLKNSSEAIFQLQPVQTGYNTWEGRTYSLPTGGPNTANPVYLTTALVNSFSANDPRRILWIKSLAIGATTYFYPNKYQKGSVVDNAITSTGQMTEYSMVLRLGEQFLIRAEARSMQNKIDGPSGATSDLNAIRSRARNSISGSIFPDDYPVGLNPATILDYIQNERKLELFTEWGDRWINSKRTGKIDGIMNSAATEKGNIWRSYQQLYPIPNADRLKNPSLTQNEGYN